MARSGSLRPGTMAAVLGMETEALQACLYSWDGEGQVVIANDNCPGQTVISGDIDAVQAVSAKLQELGSQASFASECERSVSLAVDGRECGGDG